MRKMYYHTGWARSILEQTAARVVCFDYVMPRLYVVDAFLKAAKEMSLPTLSLPHGIQLYTNEVTKPKSTDTRRFTKFNRFDYIIAPNQLRKEILIKSGVPGEKITVLGSARYCSEWLEQNNKIVPKVMDNNGSSSGRLKVVLMSSKPQCSMDVARMINTFGILADLDGIEACIKPHTRTGGSKDIFENIQLPNVSHVLTAELCEWADAMLVVGSSVITEALMRGKPALYLKYLHANTTLAEEMGACWIIHNEADLKDALLSLHTDKTQVPYEEKNIARFISEIVHGGAADSDVLDDYEKFIVGCASNTQPGSAGGRELKIED
jgi:UDP-N-acetylglucosamine 2-epimerase